MGKKPLAVKIFIWICVVLMVVSLIGVYLSYMFTPNQGTEVVSDENTGAVETELEKSAEETLIIPEINPDNPEGGSAPILVTEDGEMDEMDKTIEVQFENGETEIVRQGDLSDVLQINQ